MPRRALAVAQFALVAAAAVLLVTCSEPTTSPVITGGPSFAVSDGASGGNEDVFFLPPLVSSPHTPDYGDRPSNPDLNPVAKVCKLNATETQPNPVGGLACDPAGNVVVSLPLTYNTAGEFYNNNWQTSDTPLDTNYMYRIAVFVGRVQLVFRDVDPDPGPPRGQCKTSDDFCQFNNGSNLAIKVRIESGAVCLYFHSDFFDSDPNRPCTTASLDPGESLQLSDLGVASLLDQGATINMESCNSDPNFDFRKAGLVDLPAFKCVQINNLEEYEVQGIATLCNVVQQAIQNAGLTETQAERMTVHKNSSDTNPADLAVYALPHAAAASCATSQTVGQLPRVDRMEELLKLAKRTWRAAADQVLAWIAPAPLWANTAMVCNVGGCGGLGGFDTWYGVAQPAWETFGPGNPGSAIDATHWNLGTYNSGAQVTVTVKAFDSGELEGTSALSPEAVKNVRLTLSATGGSVTPITTCSDPRAGQVNICTGSDGVGVFKLTVGAGTNTVTVSGIGVGTQGAAGTVFNVFAPSFNNPSATEVQLGVGTLTFTANGLVPLIFVPDPPADVVYTDANGIATLPDFKVCTSPATAGVEITSLMAVTNNGTFKDLDNLPPHPWITGSDGCFTFSGVTINGTGAFKLLANGVYASKKWQSKPGH